MAVPESKRGVGKLDVLVEARKLATYTIQICCNEKVFLPQYKNAMTDKIIATATDIFVRAWTANNVLVGRDEDKFKYRQALQARAIEDCNNLLALMQIAKDLFHLKSKRVEYWGRNTITVRNKIRNWKESDRKRFLNGM